MILVTRFQGTEMYLNPDLIQSIEATPDTVMTLTNGEKFILKDKVEVIVARFIDYKRAACEPRFNAVAPQYD